MALPGMAAATGNESNESFTKAKRMLEREVYYDHRVTVYCGYEFDCFSAPYHAGQAAGNVRDASFPLWRKGINDMHGEKRSGVWPLSNVLNAVQKLVTAH